MKNKIFIILIIFCFLLVNSFYSVNAEHENKPWAYGDDMRTYDYSWGSIFKPNANDWLVDVGGEWGQFLQRALGAGGGIDAITSSICEVFVDKPGMPAGVMMGAGGYPVGHIEGSYYEYFVFNETNPYVYPDDETESGDAGEQSEIKRIYKISFEVDPKDIAGSDKLDLIFTVGGKELDLDLTNESIGNIHEIDVDGDAFFMKGETIMIRNATKSGDKWSMQTGNDEWVEIITGKGEDQDTKLCITFEKKEDLNPEFSSYLINGDKACNTFKAIEMDMGELVIGGSSGWYIPTEW